MSDFDLTTIREVLTISGERGVNAHLAAGWVLLSTCVQRDGESEWTQFTLGWPKDLPATVPDLYAGGV